MRCLLLLLACVAALAYTEPAAAGEPAPPPATDAPAPALPGGGPAPAPAAGAPAPAPVAPLPAPPCTPVPPAAQELSCLASTPPGGLSLVRGGLRTARYELGLSEQWVPATVAFAGAAAHLAPLAFGNGALYEPSTSPALVALPLTMAVFAFPVEFSAPGTGEAAKRAASVRSAGRLVVIAESMGFAYGAYALTYAVPINIAGERKVSEAAAYTVLWTAGANAWVTGMMRSRKRGGTAAVPVLIGALVSGGLAVGGAYALDQQANVQDLLTAATYGTTFGIMLPLVHL